ncbi:MAG TPA: DUF697 domain-containing protein [Myxococcales bacterium]|jgi:uncharacterized protein (DUF697 family)|nr:DUF697 domain-containing protein [Myxococcales bacterium]
MSWMDSLGSAAKPGKNLSSEERRRISGDLVNMSAMGAAAVTLAPIPVISDFALVTSVQGSMVAAVGRVYGRELTLAQAKDLLIELATVCGLGLIAQKGFATITKILLPGLGGFLAAPYAYAVTYGMGHASMTYFENKDYTKETIKRVYEEAVAEGRRIFSRETLNQFRKKKGAEVTDFAREQAEQEAAPRRKPAPRKKAAKAGAKKRPATRRPSR